MQYFLAEIYQIDCLIKIISKTLKAYNWINKQIYILTR